MYIYSTTINTFSENAASLSLVDNLGRSHSYYFGVTEGDID